MPRHAVTLMVLLDTLPLELKGIAISHHSDEDFSQRQVVDTSKSLASGTFHSENGRLERWPRELQRWPGKSHSL